MKSRSIAAASTAKAANSSTTAATSLTASLVSPPEPCSTSSTNPDGAKIDPETIFNFKA